MDEAFSRLLLELYRVARETPIDTFEDRAINLIRPLIGFERSIWGIGETTPLGFNILNIHPDHDEPEEMLHHYEEVAYQDTAAFEVMQNRGKAIAFHSPTVFKERDKSGVRALVNRFKHQNMLVVSDRSNSRFVQWMSLYRADERSYYTEEERLLCELIAPHMMEALTTNRAIHMDQIGIDQRHYARGFTDRKGVLQFSEPNLETLIQLEWPSWNGPLLPPFLMESLATHGEGRFLGKNIVICSVPQKTFLFLGARKRCNADGLSLRELEVARQIADGLSHKEVAKLLNISPATVRNHTKSIYEKLEINNKVQLVIALNLIGNR
jgi:DNA-binding CsgD family transcriptional regulator